MGNRLPKPEVMMHTCFGVVVNAIFVWDIVDKIGKIANKIETISVHCLKDTNM